jgi:hypothetical protein
MLRMNPSAGLPAGMQARLADVSAERMAATVTILASDEFAGRRVGTGGGAAARAWLADHLAALGATVETDGFPVRAVPDIHAAPTVTWGNGTTGAGLTFGREVAVHPLPPTPPRSGAARWAWPLAMTRPAGGWWCQPG